MSLIDAQNGLDRIIDNLQIALQMYATVDYNDNAKCEESPAYLIGWSTSTIKHVLLDLENIQELLKEP